ncbi:MAG: hypothetical protein HQ567_10315 [Candidatus Nealsonbacteria bacterium]|nr:hypothetical protein [Candidatus Nealsonbacteria bacterium]
MSTAEQPNTALQFSLRSLLAATTILSVLLAVFVPLVRAQPPDLQRHQLWVILGSGALAAGSLVVFCVRRWRVETRGGDLLLRPKPPSRWAGRVVWIILGVVFGGLLAFQCVILGPFVMEELPRIEPKMELGLPPMAWLFAILTFAPLILALVHGFALLWWRVTPMTLEIRENGIAYGGLKFLPWSKVTGYRWVEAKYAVQLTITSTAGKRVTAISFAERDAVQSLLDGKGAG